MDHEVEELKQLVRRNIEISKETRDMVDKMHRANRRGALFRWGWRIAAFAAIAYAYYTFVLPYIQSIHDAAARVQQTGSKFSDFFNIFGQ